MLRTTGIFLKVHEALRQLSRELQHVIRRNTSQPHVGGTTAIDLLATFVGSGLMLYRQEESNRQNRAAVWTPCVPIHRATGIFGLIGVIDSQNISVIELWALHVAH